MTYKLELFFGLPKKKNADKYKIIQKLCFFFNFFLWVTYIGLRFFKLN